MYVMHDDRWAGVDLKARHATFFLSQMSRAIEPPEETAVNVVLQSSGAIVGNLPEHLAPYPAESAILCREPGAAPGVVATACAQGKRTQHGKPHGVVRAMTTGSPRGTGRALWGGGEVRSTAESG